MSENTSLLAYYQKLTKTLRYDPHAGLFWWMIARSPRTDTNKPAGYTQKRGYITISCRVDGVKKNIYAHRLAWFMTYGEVPSEEIDHINNDKSDNRISNLRLATHAQNCKNRPKYSNNTSGVVGVHWSSTENKWRAKVTSNRVTHYLGSYLLFEEAVEAVQNKRKELHGSFAAIHDSIPQT